MLSNTTTERFLLVFLLSSFDLTSGGINLACHFPDAKCCLRVHHRENILTRTCQTIEVWMGVQGSTDIIIDV